MVMEINHSLKVKKPYCLRFLIEVNDNRMSMAVAKDAGSLTCVEPLLEPLLGSTVLTS